MSTYKRWSMKGDLIARQEATGGEELLELDMSSAAYTWIERWEGEECTVVLDNIRGESPLGPVGVRAVVRRPRRVKQWTASRRRG